jgi:hypothetical protein
MHAADHPPHVMIEQAPRPLILQRVAGIVDLSIREMGTCSPIVDRTVSGGTMITSSDPMHQDLLIVHGQPAAPSKIRVSNRLGNVSARMIVPDGDDGSLDLLRCDHGHDAIPRTMAVMSLLSLVLNAACDQRTAFRPRTIRRDDRMEDAVRRLEAIGTLILSCDERRTSTGIASPTPWSHVTDIGRGTVADGRLLWGRARTIVSLSVLPIDSAKNSWSVETSPVVSDVDLDQDPMGVLRILSRLPRSMTRPTPGS